MLWHLHGLSHAEAVKTVHATSFSLAWRTMLALFPAATPANSSEAQGMAHHESHEQLAHAGAQASKVRGSSLPVTRLRQL